MGVIRDSSLVTGKIVIERVNRLEYVFTWSGGPLAAVADEYWPAFLDMMTNADPCPLPWPVQIAGEDVERGCVIVRRID